MEVAPARRALANYTPVPDCVLPMVPGRPGNNFPRYSANRGLLWKPEMVRKVPSPSLRISIFGLRGDALYKLFPAEIGGPFPYAADVVADEGMQ